MAAHPEKQSKIRVFISSVQGELHNERKAARVLLSGDPALGPHCVPVTYEDEPASSAKALQECVALIDECRIFVLIVWKEQGHMLDDRSITHHESATDAPPPTRSTMENNRQVIVNLAGHNRQVARHPDRAQSSVLRQARSCQSSSPMLGPSRHSSRQYGESVGPEGRILGHPAILRDSPGTQPKNGRSCHFPCRNGREQDQSGQKCGHRVRIPQQPADLSAVVPQSGTKVEARDTDRALKEILEKLGV